MNQMDLTRNISAAFLAASVLVTGVGCSSNRALTSSQDAQISSQGNAPDEACPANIVTYDSPRHPQCNIVVAEQGGIIARAFDTTRPTVVTVVCLGGSKDPQGQNHEPNVLMNELTDSLRRAGQEFTRNDLGTSANGVFSTSEFKLAPRIAERAWRNDHLVILSKN